MKLNAAEALSGFIRAAATKAEVYWVAEKAERLILEASLNLHPLFV